MRRKTVNNKHCCEKMCEQLLTNCPQHSNISGCPDRLVFYDDRFDEYGLIVHDGGQSYIIINYCPWCGEKLPESCRNQWFEELEKLEIFDPSEQTIPMKFKTGDWRKFL